MIYSNIITYSPILVMTHMNSTVIKEQTELSDLEIKAFLENASLYAWREFKKPIANRANLWIKEIDAHCKKCGQVRPFHDSDLHAKSLSSRLAYEALSTGTSHFKFTCVSCGESRQEYLVEHIVDERAIRMQKCGELPRRRLNRDRYVQRFLKSDLDNYEKAVACIANEYGIAGFAYLRRVVENNITLLLDLLQDDASSSSVPKEVLDAIANLRIESPMSEKIKIANKALPPHLKPDGLNPLGRLYQVLSEGVHNLSDIECLNRAKTINWCLTYLVGELASRKEHRTKFKSMVGDLG